MVGPGVRRNISLRCGVATGTVRALVICAANQAGCAETAAVAFGRRVEDTVRNSLSGAGHDGMLPVTVRHHASTVEVVVNGHTLRLDI